MISIIGYDLRNYSVYLISILTAIIVYQSFGKPLIFDRVVIGVYFVAAVMSYRIDKNIFSIVCILILMRLIEEMLWVSDYKAAWMREFIILSIMFLCVATIKHMVSKLVLAFALLIQGVYIYWIYIGYTAGDVVGWYVIMLLQSFLTIQLIRIRVYLWRRYVSRNQEVKKNRTDKNFILVGYAYIALATIVIFEQFAIHVLGDPTLITFKSSMAYRYVSQMLAGFVLWLLFNELWRLVRQTRLFA